VNDFIENAKLFIPQNRISTMERNFIIQVIEVGPIVQNILMIFSLRAQYLLPALGMMHAQWKISLIHRYFKKLLSDFFLTDFNVFT
jgi:hypothetical protein